MFWGLSKNQLEALNSWDIKQHFNKDSGKDVKGFDSILKIYQEGC